MDRRVTSAVSAAMFLFAFTTVSHADMMKNALSRNYGEGVCSAVRTTLAEGRDAKAVVKAAIELGHNACITIKCAISGGGNPERVIIGAIEAGATPAVASRCATDAGADAREVSKYLLGAATTTCYVQPKEGYPYTPPAGPSPSVNPPAANDPRGRRALSPSGF